jgi:peptidoglycan/LPS O-acetylase OafA/YrhL
MISDRVRYLDGLRGILAAIVFVHHFIYTFCPEIIFGGNYFDFIESGPYTPLKLVAMSPLNILFNPGTAIQFFFLLSGYVQSHNYFQAPGIPFLQKSFIKRYFRLAIPTLATILLVYFFHRNHFIIKHSIPDNLLTRDWIKSIMPDTLNFPGILKHGLFGNFTSVSRYYQVLWTMPTELLNSWLILVILFVTHGLKNRLLLILIWFIVQISFLNSWYGASFTAGLLLCYFNINSKKFRLYFSHPVLKSFCLLAGVYFAGFPFMGYKGALKHTIYSPLSFFDTIPHIISYLIGTVLLFLWLMHTRAVQKWLCGRILLFFGKISFMLYLLHLLFIFSFAPWVYRHLQPLCEQHLCLTLTGLLTFGITTAFSFLLYSLVDKPVVRACNIYINKLLPASK